MRGMRILKSRVNARGRVPEMYIEVDVQLSIGKGLRVGSSSRNEFKF